MPRLISDSARCWDLIRLGKVDDIRGMLDRREMSPFDVASDGVSVLRVCELFFLQKLGLTSVSLQQAPCSMVSVLCSQSAVRLGRSRIVLAGGWSRRLPYY